MQHAREVYSDDVIDGQALESRKSDARLPIGIITKMDLVDRLTSKTR
jgi:hypothetical protein